jgi:ADP-ribose pyrophosphatase YjhB (NUDIX family)
MQLILGADCVVRNETGKVLLLKREDFRVWTIPGGGSDPGEHPSATAIRETHEETGVDVALEQLVGVYTFKQAHSLMFVYTARAVGGTLQTSWESVDVRYFPPDALPGRMVGLHRDRLLDALRETPGVFRYQPYPLWAKVLLPAMLRARKLRNRLQGRPEPRPVRRDVIVQGVWNGTSGATITITPQPGEPVWETLRRQAAREAGQPVRVARVLDVLPAPDPVTVRFALEREDRE